MADNEKTTGVPIEDDALDNIAGGVEITREMLEGLPKLDVPNKGAQPLYSFDEACESIKSTLDWQNNPNNNYTAPSDRLNMTMEDYMKEGLKKSLENQK